MWATDGLWLYNSRPSWLGTSCRAVHRLHSLCACDTQEHSTPEVSKSPLEPSGFRPESHTRQRCGLEPYLTSLSDVNNHMALLQQYVTASKTLNGSPGERAKAATGRPPHHRETIAQLWESCGKEQVCLMWADKEPPKKHLHPCQTETACQPHGSRSCSSAWEGFRLPRMGGAGAPALLPVPAGDAKQA